MLVVPVPTSKTLVSASFAGVECELEPAKTGLVFEYFLGQDSEIMEIWRALIIVYVSWSSALCLHVSLVRKSPLEFVGTV